jgi:hypothetical protein
MLKATYNWVLSCQESSVTPVVKMSTKSKENSDIQPEITDVYRGIINKITLDLIVAMKTMGEPCLAEKIIASK